MLYPLLLQPGEPGPPPVPPAETESEGTGESEAESCDYDFWLQGSDAWQAGQGPVWGRRGSDVRLQFSEWPQGGADVTGWCLVTWGPRASDLHHIPPWLAASSNCFFRAWKETRVLELWNVLFLWQVWGNSDYCQSRQIKDGKFWHCVNICWQNSQSVKQCSDNVDTMTIINMETAEKIKLRGTCDHFIIPRATACGLSRSAGCGHKNSGQKYFPVVVTRKTLCHRVLFPTETEWRRLAIARRKTSKTGLPCCLASESFIRCCSHIPSASRPRLGSRC